MLVEGTSIIKEKIFILNKKEKYRDGCVRFKKVQQQENEVQSTTTRVHCSV